MIIEIRVISQLEPQIKQQSRIIDLGHVDDAEMGNTVMNRLQEEALMIGAELDEKRATC